jgi:hypothetical protein
MFILLFIPGVLLIYIIFCNILYSKGKGTEIRILAWTGPEGSRRLRFPEYLDSWHLKVARLLALCTGCLYPLLEGESVPGP